MKILVCPDSFKGTLTSFQACKAIEKGLKQAGVKASDITLHPTADGGDGTIDALLRTTKSIVIKTNVQNSYGKIRSAKLLQLDNNTVFIEASEACGIIYTPIKYRKPLNLSTFGVGQLIKKALDLKIKNIYIGVGGSSTNDGGIGMAGALGLRLFDKDNKEIRSDKNGYTPLSLDNFAHINIDNLDKRIKNVQIIVCSDVKNSLLGDKGASKVYGPQKGASKKEIIKLEKLLTNLNNVCKKDLKIDLNQIVGGGASGGLGAALVGFLKAEIRPGLNEIAKLTKLIEKIKEADIIITGEGCMDEQTSFDKTPFAILKIAKQFNKSVYGLSGFLKKSPGGFDKVYGTNNLVDFDEMKIGENASQMLSSLGAKFANEVLNLNLKRSK